MTGYVLGTVFSLVFGGAAVETAVYLTYLLSGVAIALFSFVFHIKGSGHACGVSGPVAILSFFLGLPYLCGYLLLGAVCRASVALKKTHKGTAGAWQCCSDFGVCSFLRYSEDRVFRFVSAVLGVLGTLKKLNNGLFAGAETEVSALIFLFYL